MEGMEEILKEFIVETYEGLDELDRDLVSLEDDPSSTELISRIFRTIHTIKGSSGFLSLHKLESIAHVGENLLSLLRDGERTLTSDMTSALLSMADAVRQIVDQVEREQAEGDADYTALVSELSRLVADEQDQDTAEPAAEAPIEAPAEDTFDDELPTASADDVDESTTVPPTADPGASATAEAPSDNRSSSANNTIRVGVDLLDTLMNLVGELVLARNQILQHTVGQDEPALTGTSQRLNLVTTELQEGVMKTRMQPIGNVWSKFPRVVRDLAISCEKKVRIEMEGRDTELDKTIIEAIKDPLTHAIRNAVDHGIEPPEVRRERNKPETGLLKLRAFHEGGQVNIEISDDGGGIDPTKVRDKAIRTGLITGERAARMGEKDLINLITMPGFSTAEAVTNVSGRGVGMDVVRTNIEKIGGAVDIQSNVGEGTTLKIKIPLTLAIIPALIVASDKNRFAIPQVNLLELVRLEGGQGRTGIETIHGCPVYRLRGNLLPLVYLDHELEIATTSDAGPETREASPADDQTIVNIVVLQAEDRQFGLVVESILDTEEIVVKPMGKQLKSVPAFAGAAIMGDGKVALILDVVGLARKASILSEDGRSTSLDQVDLARTDRSEHETLLLVSTGGQSRAAIQLSTVARLEEFEPSAIERTGDQEVVQYRDEIMPLIRVSRLLGNADASHDTTKVQVIVVRTQDGRSVGLAVDRILDIVEDDIKLAEHTSKQGVRGAIAIQGRVTDFLDVEGIITAALPGFVEASELMAIGD